MHVSNVTITLSSDDWYKVIFALDCYSLDPQNEHILPGPECTDYADTLFERVQKARPLRVRDWPVSPRQGFNGGTPCPCTVCSRNEPGGL